MLENSVERRGVLGSCSPVVCNNDSIPSPRAEEISSVVQEFLQDMSEVASSCGSETSDGMDAARFPARDSLDILGASDEDFSEEEEGLKNKIVSEDYFSAGSATAPRKREESKRFEVESVGSNRASKSSFSIARLFRKKASTKGYKA